MNIVKNINKKPLFSVVIPLYNSGKYIARAVNSVLAQSHEFFELIIVDDGSTDDGSNIVENINDSRIRLIKQSNTGVSIARNNGIVHARGKFIAFLDADDSWDSEFLSVILELISIHPNAGLYSTGFRMAFPKGRDLNVAIRQSKKITAHLIHDYFQESAINPFIHTSGVVMPHHLFSSLGMFAAGVKHGEDQEMWARVALRYPISYDNRVLFTFYQTSLKNKPRYHSSLVDDPVLGLLKNYLLQNNQNVKNYAQIEYYMTRYFRRTCFSFIALNKHDDLVDYIVRNKMYFFGISGSLIKKILFWRLLLNFIYGIYKIKHCRLVKRIRNKQHGKCDKL